MSKRKWKSIGKCNYIKADRKLHNRELNVLINEAKHDRIYRKKTQEFTLSFSAGAVLDFFLLSQCHLFDLLRVLLFIF
jgi:hypothetical protein